MEDGDYLRRLKKSGTSKQSYYFRFPFSGFSGRYVYYYHYHYYNPLRVANFHINHWALAD
jgi:hypothetical protein